MSVTNSYANSVKLAKAAMSVLEGDAALLKHVRRSESLFKNSGDFSAGGDTAFERIPGYGKWREGKVAQPSAISTKTIGVTLNQGGADFQVTSQELTLNIDSLQEIIRPRIACVINQMDEELWAYYKKIPITYGTAGTRPTGLLPFLDAKAAVRLIGGVDDDGSMAAVLHEFHEASLVDGQKALFNSQPDISKQYKTGKMGMAAGLKFTADRNAPTHTAGVYSGTPVMNGTTAEGATTLVTDGWGAGSILNEGDSFTLGGVYAVRPVGKGNTGILKPFVAASTATADGSGNMTITITEAIYASTTNPDQNVTALPLNEATITPFAASGTTSKVSMVLHPDALVFASVPLEDMGENCAVISAPELKATIRCYQYTNGNADSKLWRLDILRGHNLGRAGFAARIFG